MENSGTTTMATETAIKRRRRTRTKDKKEPVQFYRPKNIPPELQQLLELEDLTADEIRTFLTSGRLDRLQAKLDESATDPYALQVEQYRTRRQRLRTLIEGLRTGASRIDDDGRLVDANNGNNVEQNPPLPPVAPPPQPPNDNQNFLPLLLDNDEEERRWRQQEERLASASIARAVERYRSAGVPFEEVELVPVLPIQARNPNFTFRRICFAVFAVVTAFVCIMVQTFPMWETEEEEKPETIDKLMHHVLDVRLLKDHDTKCPDLDRTNNMGSRKKRLLYALGWPSAYDCSDGVLHIPATEERFVNKSYFFPCQPVPATKDEATDDTTFPSSSSSCYPGRWRDAETSCLVHSKEGERERLCFRGVHDNFLSEKQIGDAMRMGSTLISMGGDHFDIHYDVSFLKSKLPSVLDSIRSLLRKSYAIPAEMDLQPVAFRVNAVAPMDGEKVPLYGLQASDHPLIRLLNRTRYLRWMHESMRQNEVVAQYYSSLPWPFRMALSTAARDTCNLMADQQADPRFSILTSFFLNDGAGKDFRGGVSLFADRDRHVSKVVPKYRPRKIRRGLTVEGSAGRLVLSTGGFENRRCRLPTRAGIRATLQIWWDC